MGFASRRDADSSSFGKCKCTNRSVNDIASGEDPIKSRRYTCKALGVLWDEMIGKTCSDTVASSRPRNLPRSFSGAAFIAVFTDAAQMEGTVTG